jgi:hypothetical protein
MPLDDREQRILAEIERQFYEEDPDLAHAVRNISHRGLSRWGLRWSIAGFLVGIVLLLATFRVNVLIASVGFVLIVVSATAAVQAVRHGDTTRSGEGSGRLRSWVAKTRDRRRDQGSS